MAFTSAHGAAPSFSGAPALLARWIILAGTDARFEQVQSGGVFRRCKILSGQPQPERDRTPRKGLQRASLSVLPQDNSAGNFVKVRQRVPVRIQFSKDNDIHDMQKLRAGMNVECEVKY